MKEDSYKKLNLSCVESFIIETISKDSSKEVDHPETIPYNLYEYLIDNFPEEIVSLAAGICVNTNDKDQSQRIADIMSVIVKNVLRNVAVRAAEVYTDRYTK